ncbi:hypothetical protein EJ05DRAFT_473780 [Pseudovirgaria hyperparasitica]|uniref:Endoplasmic reticulum junction formation protein lunapark n=1 Tax=Pseudovirgaria hyperparasitica TaxID=470096 RepID=A0A6A6WEJ6_9PEZI|nr:uncharacterized protein EJ05DRAFT_473780 [Pseudovirgaria hyperparasitica]KAF2761242.1 hypothetical protein EJ05DRAFT_473780 [Pseudovirgaria hyperparasitica]
MVSLWPFKGEASAADFEKTLSNLATKIQKTGARNDRLRQSSRRMKVLWTLYTGFAYLIAALILTLVTGWQNWTAYEVTGLAGAPVLIYGVRKALTLYYDYRIRSTQEYLDSLNKDRDATIEKLKTATKYNSTQQLLDKYGSSSSPKQPGKQNPQQQQQGKQDPQQSRSSHQQPQPQRTNMPPPATANIPRGPPNTANIPQGPSPALTSRALGPPASPVGSTPRFLAAQYSPGAEFAPNAFSTPTQYTQEPQWYDRILDVLLGEDENKTSNRLAMLCSQCRLVNGLAPPGVKRLEELGRWKCSGCGAWNGVENEAKKLVEQIASAAPVLGDDHVEEEVHEPERSRSNSPELVGVDETKSPAQSTRSRRKK